MTNRGKGSILIVDEADNILNTQYSWFMRGKTQDKGYLNHLLEETGVRIIWSCNTIANIEDSVLRRFAYSLSFKPFNKRQRVSLFENIIRQNRMKRYFSSEDIEALALRYDVNAGVIALSVKKAIESNCDNKSDFLSAVKMGLDAYKSLSNSGNIPKDHDRIEHNYSIDGLNISGDIHLITKQLEKFSDYLRNSHQKRILNMNLIFYGPPGTGKSEFARYIA